MVKNLNVNKDFFKRKVVAPLLIVGTLVTGGFAIKNTVHKKNDSTLENISVSTIANANGDNIYFDEYYDYDDTYLLYAAKDIESKDNVEGMNVYESIDLVERCYNLEQDINELVKKYDEVLYFPITSTELKSIPNIDELESQYNELKIKLATVRDKEDKIVIIRDLKRISELCNKYYNKRLVCEATLKRVIKSQVGGLIGLEPSEYEKCVISDRIENNKNATVTYSLDNSTKVYKVKLGSESGIYLSAINLLWDIQEKKEVNVNHFLNIIKQCLLTETIIDENGNLIDIGIVSDVFQKIKLR